MRRCGVATPPPRAPFSRRRRRRRARTLSWRRGRPAGGGGPLPGEIRARTGRRRGEARRTWQRRATCLHGIRQAMEALAAAAAAPGRRRRAGGGASQWQRRTCSRHAAARTMPRPAAAPRPPPPHSPGRAPLGAAAGCRRPRTGVAGRTALEPHHVRGCIDQWECA